MKKLLEEYGINTSQLRRVLGGRKKKPKILKLAITDKIFEFGIVSDTHLGSIHEKLDELHTFYEICRKAGIKHVVHAGDLVAGTFEGQTTFQLRKRINPMIGGWTVQCRIANDKLNSIVAFTPTWIPFFGGGYEEKV